MKRPKTDLVFGNTYSRLKTRVIGVDDYRLASGLAVSMWGFSALPEVPDPISCGIARPSFDLTRAKHQVSIPLG